jgi:hypothetical protein
MIMADNAFQLAGFVFPGVTEDPFGMWDVVPATGGVSFAAGEAAQPEEPLHRANFASVDEGRTQLQLKHDFLSEQEALLQRAEQRLAEIGQSGSGVSFAAPIDQPPEFVQPEQNLEAALQRITAPVSYGLFDRKRQEEQEPDLEATSQWWQFLEQVREMIAHYARIDVTAEKIQMEGKATLRAYTAISLDGDTTVLAPTDAAGEINQSIWELHQATLKQALDNRATMIKTMGDAAAAALKALGQAGG